MIDLETVQVRDAIEYPMHRGMSGNDISKLACIILLEDDVDRHRKQMPYADIERKQVQNFIL